MRMRIMGGQLRGRSYKVRTDDRIRPISSRIKKSLFDILAPRLAGARVLDLFAGTGAVGLEALSRGAACAFFVDSSRKMVDGIESALSGMGLGDRGKAQVGDALEDLSWVPHRGGAAAFDIVFMGPPYRDTENRPFAYSGRALARVAESGLLAPDAVVISQHHAKEQVPEVSGLERVRREKYGDSDLDFYRAKGPAA